MRAWIALVGAATAAVVATATWAVRHHRRWRALLTQRIPGHHDHWRERGRALEGSVLYVALGDSAALGLGASTPDRGYVGLIAREIGRLTGRPVRVRNLSIDGARLETVIRDELHRIPKERALVVTLDAGANDIWTFDPQRFRAQLEQICAALPASAIVADLPSFAPIPIGGRVARANRIVRDVAAPHGLAVAPLNATTRRGGPITAIRNAAGDLFHPNDRGHEQWAAAFLPLVRERLAQQGFAADPRPAS